LHNVREPNRKALLLASCVKMQVINGYLKGKSEITQNSATGK
jgi:hypothetical protein